MVMNGFDTNFDRANEFYAANTIGFAYMDRPIADPARRARPCLPGQRARVRPRQLVPPARQPLPLLPDRHVEDPVGADRHGDALPGAARASSSGASRTPGATCSTRTSPSSPSSAGRASSRSRDRTGATPGVAARGCAAGPDRRRDRRVRAARRPRTRRAARAAGRGAGGRADRARARHDRADRAQRRAGRGADRAGPGQRRVRAVLRRRGPDRAAGDRDGAALEQPWVEGEAYEVALVTSAGRDDHARDPGGRRDAGERRLVLRADGAARRVRRGDPDRARHALAAVDAAASRRRGCAR